MNKLILIGILVFIMSSCRQGHNKTLPILGNPEINGEDTTYPSISDFRFMDQDSVMISNSTFADKVYVADFIFLSCPSICPIMTREMLKVYHAFEGDNRVAFISHTIDPIRDTIVRLRAYADKFGIKETQWHFVTGDQDTIFDLAEHSYFSIAHPDSTAPGGFTHSGGLLLVDKYRHIRGVYDGTNSEETQRLIQDIHILLGDSKN